MTREKGSVTSVNAYVEKLVVPRGNQNWNLNKKQDQFGKAMSQQ